MSIKKRIAHGAAWMLGARFAIKSLGFISTLILARLLMPEDFGVVAIASAVVGGIRLLKTFGFDTALIQDQDAGVDKYNAAWTINLLFSLFFGFVLFILAKPAASFFGDMRLQSVIAVLTLTVILQGFENVGVVDFRKNLEFRKEFIFLTTRKLAGFMVKIPLAFIYKSYWALVIGLVFSSVVGLIMSYSMHRFRPTIGFRGLRELFDFSKWLFINNLLYFVRHRAADFVLGRQSGPRAVGLFSVAKEISDLVTHELVAPINRAVFPGYAILAKDDSKLKAGYLEVMSVIAILALPTAAGIVSIAEYLIPLLLGPNWTPTIPLVQVLAFSGAIAILETNIGAAYLAMGRPKVVTFLFSFFAATFLTGLLILTPEYGAIGAAWASLIASVANIPLQIFMMHKHLKIGMRDLYAVFFRPVVASAIMFAVLNYVSPMFSRSGEVGAQIGIVVALTIIGALTYFLATSLLWLLAGRPNGPESYVFDRYLRSASRMN